MSRKSRISISFGQQKRTSNTSQSINTDSTSSPLMNLTPQFCRRALTQGHTFIKCNSFNRKQRVVSCPLDLSVVTWRSTKEHKKHEDKGSISTSELRSVLLDNLHLKLKFDSRTLDFLCTSHLEAREWSGIFSWLLNNVEENRLETLFGQNNKVKKRFRSSTVCAGIRPRLAHKTYDSSNNTTGSSSKNIEQSDVGNDTCNVKYGRAESFINPISSGKSNNHQSLRSQLDDPNNESHTSMSNAKFPSDLADSMLSQFDSDRHAMYRLISRLMEGNAFTRYKPNQKPKSRYVWCSMLLDSIMYSLDKEHKEATKPRGHLPTMEIQQVVKGGVPNILDQHFLL